MAIVHLPGGQAAEIAGRRSCAIISHPDAGKTMLTGHLLRGGGAIQLAGNVHARRERRCTRSDWIGAERERGTSGMTFEHAGCEFDRRDRPRQETFSEDIHRTMTAAEVAPGFVQAARRISHR